MANRAITTMPIWGLSALAVGSIGAPLPGNGKTDIPSHTVSLEVPTADILPVLQLEPFNSTQPRLATSRSKPSLQAVGALQGMGQGSGAYGADGSVSERNTNVLNYMFANSTVAAATAAIGNSANTNKTPLPALATTHNASPVDLGLLKKLDSTAGAAPNAQPKVLPGRVGSPLQLGSNQAIYGTSANNAYKVYFPQIEPPAAGTSIGQMENFGEAPEQDDRVLKKSGSYLFYESPSEIEVGQKIGESLNADGVVDAEALARAVAKLGKGAEEQKLTTPALQKKPLDFGQGLFKASTLPENTPTTPAGDADVDQ